MERVTALHTLNAPYDNDGNPEGHWLVCLVSPAARAALLSQPPAEWRVQYSWSGGQWSEGHWSEGEERRGHLRRFLSAVPAPQGDSLALVQPDTP